MQGITRSLLDVMATKASLPVRRAGTQVLSQMSGVRISRNYSNPTRYRSLAVRRNVRRNKAFDLKPSLEVANAMPNSPPEMDNGTLVTLAWLGNFHACSEMLIRNIMQVDKVDYDTAIKTFDLIAAKNREGMFLLALPYQIGITAALVAGFGSLPMVFSLPVAEWFNQYYVTTDVPEPQDLETMLEIGSWVSLLKRTEILHCISHSLTIFHFS